MIKISTFQNRKRLDVFSGLSKKPTVIYLESKDFQYIQRFKESYPKISTNKWQELREIKDFAKLTYYIEVWTNTQQYENVTKFAEQSTDHIVPISYGFKYNIPASLIGSFENCQTLSSEDNLLKGKQLTVRAKEILKVWGLT